MRANWLRSWAATAATERLHAELVGPGGNLQWVEVAVARAAAAVVAASPEAARAPDGRADGGVPKVTTRLHDVRRGNPAKDAAKAFEQIDARPAPPGHL
jgi:hypothetical protein